MCTAILADVINELESGAYPQPVFFNWADCRFGRWPPTRESLPLTMYGAPIQRETICPSQNKQQCPAPFWLSMILPPNIRVTFNAYTNNAQPQILARVQEPGQTRLYGSDFAQTNFLPNLTTSSKLQWYSPSGDGQKMGANGGTDDCALPVGTLSYTPFENNTDPTRCNVTHPQNCKMMRSTISCGSPLWPSFFAADATAYGTFPRDSDPLWTGCRRLPDKPQDSLNLGTDYCTQFGVGNIEESVISSVWADADDACTAQPYTSNPAFFNACGCLANLAEAAANETHNTYIVFPDSGGCNTRNCGMCRVNALSVNTDYSCACTDDTFTIQGSVQNVQIDFVDNNKNVISWGELQTLWCYSGASVAGIKLDLYTEGTPFCDNVMRAACINTAELTLNPDLMIACACIIEEKRLRAQFAGIDLPSQCFSSACSVSQEGVYRTREQQVDCSARLCQQVLTVNGSAMLAQGFQEVVCNATLYDIPALQAANDVPLVSQVQPAYGAFELGAPFFVSLGVFLLLIALIIIYVIQTIRESRRSKIIKQEQNRAALVDSLLT